MLILMSFLREHAGERRARGHVELLGDLRDRPLALDRRDRHLGLEGRRVVLPQSSAPLASDSQAQPCRLSGRRTTYPTVESAPSVKSAKSVKSVICHCTSSL